MVIIDYLFMFMFAILCTAVSFIVAGMIGIWGCEIYEKLHGSIEDKIKYTSIWVTIVLPTGIILSVLLAWAILCN